MGVCVRRGTWRCAERLPPSPLRYSSQMIDLEHKLKPFIPDFIPAVGDIDAFLKVLRSLGPGGSVCPMRPFPGALAAGLWKMLES